MYGYIYKTTCLVTLKIYVGQKHSTKFLGEKYLGSGKLISLAIEKYGKENFKVELVQICENQEELDTQEIYWISYYDARNPEIGYNLAEGGKYWSCGYHQGMKGKTQSDYQKEQARIANSYKRSEETRKKMSNSAKNRTKNRITNNDKIWICNGTEEFLIDKNEVDLYSRFGFEINKRIPRTSEYKERMKIKYSNGTYVNKDNKDIFISNTEVENYIAQGYSLNRSKYTKSRCENISKGKKGTICINNGKKNFYIKPELLEQYTKQGYVKGYIKNKQTKRGELRENLQEDNPDPSL